MKRKNKSSIFDALDQRFPPIPLYRSDLEEIINIAETRKLVVSISDDTHEFDSMNDLKDNLGDRIMRLSISMYPEKSDFNFFYIQIKIDEDGIKLHTSKDDKLIAVWHEIKEVIEKRLPWYARFMRPFPWFLIGATIFWLIPNESDQLQEGFEWVTKLGFAVAVFSYLLGLISLWYLQRSRGIYLQRQHEIKGIWDRYGEKVILLILGTVLGVIGKLISEKLFM